MKDGRGTFDTCIHCHKCREQCEFLKKYKLDIGDTQRLKELAYSCFLCGRCSEVCPVGIDGKQEVLNLRKERAKRGGKQPGERGCGFLLMEKRRYLFYNDRNLSGKSVLFPGCNFPSFYPETTKYLANLLRREAGTGTLFDCCGKPLSDLGLWKEEKRILMRLEKKLKISGISEIIVLCPGCYEFLKERLSVKVTGIYETLRRLGLGRQVKEELSFFLPCPDRKEKELLNQILPFLDRPPDICRTAQCCGLGGCAAGRERELADWMGRQAAEYEKNLTVYCASCAGSFVRKGREETEHILVKIMETGEKADTAHSLLNRMKFKCWKGETE